MGCALGHSCRDFRGLVATIDHHLSGSIAEETFIWVDIFAGRLLTHAMHMCDMHDCTHMY